MIRIFGGRLFGFLALAALANFHPLAVTKAAAQAMTLEEFAAKVDQRAGTLAGFQAYLTDPDQQRAMSALQIMLESGDPTLVQMALSVGVYSVDPNIRQTALKAFLAGAPSLDLFLDGGATFDDKDMESYNALLRGYNGAVGADKRASLSLRVGEWSDEKGCYLNLDTPQNCLLRVNATTVSLFLVSKDGNTPAQWVVMELGEDGALTGSIIARHYRTDIGPLALSMRLSE